MPATTEAETILQYTCQNFTNSHDCIMLYSIWLLYAFTKVCHSSNVVVKISFMWNQVKLNLGECYNNCRQEIPNLPCYILNNMGSHTLHWPFCNVAVGKKKTLLIWRMLSFKRCAPDENVAFCPCNPVYAITLVVVHCRPLWPFGVSPCKSDSLAVLLSFYIRIPNWPTCFVLLLNNKKLESHAMFANWSSMTNELFTVIESFIP